MPSQAFLHPKFPLVSQNVTKPFPTPMCTQTAPLLKRRRAPRKFVRLRSTKSGTLLQTAITTYKSPEKTLHIHSLVHLAEPGYYNALKSPAHIVFYELITHSANTTPPPRRLKSSVTATPSARVAARRLSVVAQADVLDLQRPGWFVADLPLDLLPRPSKSATIPDKLLLRLVSVILPCPELNLLALDLRGITPAQILQLLKAPLQDKRRLLYAWRCEKTTMQAVNSSADETTKLRDDAAWECVRDAKGEVALLYGAWHSGRFCRLAEACGMLFVRRKWVTAMRVPVIDVHWWDWGVWGLLGGVYCAIAGWDWVAGVENGLVLDWADVFWYGVRHGFAYIAVRRWFEELV